MKEAGEGKERETEEYHKTGFPKTHCILASQTQV